MIDARRAQFNFGDKLIADEVDGLYEEWMIHVDQVLADEQIVAAAYAALAKRRLLSRTCGRRASPPKWSCARSIMRQRPDDYEQSFETEFAELIDRLDPPTAT